MSYGRTHLKCCEEVAFTLKSKTRFTQRVRVFYWITDYYSLITDFVPRARFGLATKGL